MKIINPQGMYRDKMEDEDEDDNEIFDVLFADDEDPDNNSVATLEWLGWDFKVVLNKARDGSSLVYGIPDWYVN